MMKTGCLGYRRLTAMLQQAGWPVGKIVWSGSGNAKV
jgi:hypothetical protein